MLRQGTPPTRQADAGDHPGPDDAPGTPDDSPAAARPGRRGVDRRLMGVAAVVEIQAVFVAYLVVNVPVGGPRLTRREALMHWHPAAIGALVVLAGVVLVVWATLRARRRGAAPGARGETAAFTEREPGTETGLPRVPRSLRLERVTPAALKVAGGLSLATIPVSVLLGAHLGLAWVLILAPWVPLVVLEIRQKSARDKVFACFGLLALVQVLHMVEHSAQVVQLLASRGDLRHSHGFIGQLDFELVHFVTDSGLWISLGLLTIIFRGRNTWLWIAFAAASVHQVEHFYLFWLNKFENTVYLSGGAAGIMGRHGLIGSPLDRPYLHFTYNFIVLVPLLIAFWDEARRMDRLTPRATRTPRAAPERPAAAPVSGG